MNCDTKLYEYILDKSWQLTEEWYTSINKEETAGVYLSENPAAVERLKKQNNEFHKKFAEIFIKQDTEFLEIFEEWVIGLVHDEGHLETPSYLITGEFFRTQKQYMTLVDEFFEICEGCTNEDLNRWKNMIGEGIGRVISWFLKEQHDFTNRQSREQQQTINKLSSPIILLNKRVGLLPLIGKIDDVRAEFMLENTLEVCSNRGLRQLLIDLSGVVTVNTFVAHKIFELIDALALIGVDAILSGIRPEIAQTAVQFGDRFSRMTIVTNLEKAIDLYLK
ncbi:STAS domain-containing protein [Aciduricibacillus chroicocephali]|uniref:STAS domain-containing protein n=1 Tax=Aciduricibacillus chroicocephali TaxID=3054939 RepID=A0ABY9KVR7_9BACI|nr:STAS domain-containing protein [Bacillaceae bacterium 44XB]